MQITHFEKKNILTHLKDISSFMDLTVRSYDMFLF